MKRSIVLCLTLMAPVALSVNSVSANCIPAKTFGSLESTTGQYTYINFGDFDSDLSSFRGSFYTPGPGSKSTNNNGTYPISEWLRKYYDGTDNWYLQGNLGDARVLGCPFQTLTVEIWADNGNAGDRTFIKLDADENFVRQYNFNFAGCDGRDFLTAATAPVYRVTSSSRTGDTVTTHGNISSANAGEYSCDGATNPIEAINVYTLSSPDPPPSDVGAGWTLDGAVGPNGGEYSVDADCPTVNEDLWVATGIVAGGDPLVLGTPTRIECDRILADPRIRIHGRPGTVDRVHRPDR